MSNPHPLTQKDALLCKELAAWSQHQPFSQASNPALPSNKTAWTIRLTILLKEMDIVESVKATGKAAGLTVLRILPSTHAQTTTNLTQTDNFHIIPLRFLSSVLPRADGVPLRIGEVVDCDSTVCISGGVELLCITEHWVGDIRVTRNKEEGSGGRGMDVIEEEG